MLALIEVCPPIKGKHPSAVYLCSCGKEIVALIYDVNHGHTKSCGCLSRRRARERMTTHGMTGTKEWRAWKGMKERCYYTKHVQYENYGGRGISVCDRWINSFDNFLSDVGHAPSAKHSVDRIDVNGNYEPGNIRWATAKEQGVNRTNNKTIEWRGKTWKMHELTPFAEVPAHLIAQRLRMGWDLDRAILQKIGERVLRETGTSHE